MFLFKNHSFFSFCSFSNFNAMIHGNLITSIFVFLIIDFFRGFLFTFCLLAYAKFQQQKKFRFYGFTRDKQRYCHHIRMFLIWKTNAFIWFTTRIVTEIHNRESCGVAISTLYTKQQKIEQIENIIRVRCTYQR